MPRRKRPAPVEQQVASHTRRMLHGVAKAVETQQIHAQENEGFVDLYGDLAITPPLPLDALLQIMEENALHAGCIEAKTKDSVGRGWKLEQEDDAEKGADKDEDAVARQVRDWLRSVCKQPDDSKMPFSHLISQFVREKIGIGWGAIEVGRGKDGTIASLYPCPGHTLRVVQSDRNLLVQRRGEKKVYFKRFGVKDNYDSATGRKAQDGDANELLILKEYSPRTPFYGIPRWVSGIPPVAEFSAIREYNVSWFSSGGVGDRSIHVTSRDPEVAKTLADSILEQLTNAKGVGHTTVVSHGDADTNVAIEQLNPTVGNRDGQFRNRRSDLAQEILIAHQTPPFRVGWPIMGGLGGSTAGETLDAYRYGEVEPEQEGVEELLNDTIFNEEAGGFPLPGYVFRFKQPDWSQYELEIEKAKVSTGIGLATGNEGREMIGLERSDDPAMDIHYVVTKDGPVRLSDALLGNAPVATEVTAALRDMKKSLDAAVAAERAS